MQAMMIPPSHGVPGTEEACMRSFWDTLFLSLVLLLVADAQLLTSGFEFLFFWLCVIAWLGEEDLEQLSKTAENLYLSCTLLMKRITIPKIENNGSLRLTKLAFKEKDLDTVGAVTWSLYSSTKHANS